MDSAEYVRRVLDAYCATPGACGVVRRPDAPPLGLIRSLAYFGPVIDEVLESPAGPDYYRYLRHRLPHWLAAQRSR